MNSLVLLFGVVLLQTVRSDHQDLSVEFECTAEDVNYMAKYHCLQLNCGSKGATVEKIPDCKCGLKSGGERSAHLKSGISLPDTVDMIQRYKGKRYIGSGALEFQSSFERRLDRRCRFGSQFIRNKVTKKVPEHCLSVTCRVNKDKSAQTSTRTYSLDIKPLDDCICSHDDAPVTTANPFVETATLPDCDYEAEFGPDHSALNTEPLCSTNKLGVTDEEIAEILKTHNDLRAKVARGEESRGSPGPQPSAANMIELVWNEELAYVAQGLANTCVFAHDCGDCRRICSRDYYVGQNIFMSSSSSTDSAWTQAITLFYDEVELFDPASIDPFVFNYNAGHYTQVAWANTAEVGCGAVYGDSKIYVCNYGPGGNFIGATMYEKGDPATNCVFGTSSTYDGLCAPDPSLIP